MGLGRLTPSPPKHSDPRDNAKCVVPEGRFTETKRLTAKQATQLASPPAKGCKTKNGYRRTGSGLAAADALPIFRLPDRHSGNVERTERAESK